MSSHEHGLGENLFNSSVEKHNYPDTEYQRHLFEQYKICIEMADRISHRRNLANTLMLTLNTGVLATLATMVERSALDIGGLLMVVAAFFGLIASCFAWRTLISSYRQLNTAKFKVIGVLETHLPSSPFCNAEWSALGRGKNPMLYKPLSSVESHLPTIIAAVYLAILMIIVVSNWKLVANTIS